MSQNMLTGLGVDIVEVERMEHILERTPSFRIRVFSEGEREYCDSKHRPAVHYAMRFAAKEAVLKALGVGFASGIRPTDIEVVHNEKGRPEIKLYGRAAQYAQEANVLEVHISLSRTHETAVANAVATTASSHKEPEEKGPSAKEELAATFKELRSMLDTLDADQMSAADVEDAKAAIQEQTEALVQEQGKDATGQEQAGDAAVKEQAEAKQADTEQAEAELNSELEAVMAQLIGEDATGEAASQEKTQASLEETPSLQATAQSSPQATPLATQENDTKKA